MANNISKQFFGKDIDQLNTEELYAISEKYPYWNIPHVLAASKEKVHRSKASLYINNPLWFSYLLQAKEDDEEIIIVKEEKKEFVHAEPKLKDILITAPVIEENVQVFEPMHATDYFASQGIKLDLNGEPKDKLTRQLKSFTDWLKVMKKINPDKLKEAEEDDAEKEVQGFAQTSILEKEVVTEAMAEVWLKQGNTPKALEMYEKLSLLNPSKNAYFAARIKQIKNY